MANSDGEINIRVNTTADATGLDQAKKGLAGVKQEAKEVRTGFRGMLDQIAAAPGLMGKLTAAVGIVSAAFVALKGAIALARKAFNEFAEDEVRFRSWGQAAANAGVLTQGYADKVRDLIDKMERLTKIEGAKWFAAIEEVTKRGVGPDNIEKVVKGIADLAGAMGKDGDIETAAKILAQAMDGNIIALKRFGIEVDKTKSKAEQFDQILEQLAERGAGILEKRGKTLSGEMKGVRLAFDSLMQAGGGLISRTGLLQISFSFLANTLNNIKKLLPETKHSIDDLKNASPKLAENLKEAGKAAGASAEGFKDATSALDTLRKAYDDTAKAADEFRRQQDSLDDASTSAALAEIDFQVESGQLTEEEGRLARSGLRRDSAHRKAQREIDSISTQEKKLGSDRTMAEIEVYRTDAEAKFKGGFRDALMQKAAKEFGLEDPNDLRNPRRFEMLTTGPGYWEMELERLTSHRGNLNRRDYQNSILGIEPGMHTEGDLTRFEMQIREKMAEENAQKAQRAAKFEDLPAIIKDADASDEAARAAREKLQNIRAVANPKLQQLGNRRTEIGFTQRTADLENRTELVGVARERSQSSGTEGLGAEISKSTNLQQSNGNELLQVVRDQQQALIRLARGIQDRDADNKVLWGEVRKIEGWIRHSRNR